MWDYITYLFPKDTSLILHLTGRMITYPCLDLSHSMLVNGVTGIVLAYVCRNYFHVTESQLSYQEPSHTCYQYKKIPRLLSHTHQISSPLVHEMTNYNLAVWWMVTGCVTLEQKYWHAVIKAWLNRSLGCLTYAPQTPAGHYNKQQ